MRWSVLALAALAGCLDVAPQLAEEAAPAPVLPLRLEVGGVVAAGASPLVLLEGRELNGSARDQSDKVLPTCWLNPCNPPCLPVNCDRLPLRVEVADGFWDAREGALEITVLSARGNYSYWVLRLYDADGVLVAENRNGEAEALLVVPKPASASFVLDIVSDYGWAPYVAGFRLHPLPAASGREILPDLVTLPPSGFRIDTGRCHWVGVTVCDSRIPKLDHPLHPRRCYVEERVEEGAQRCLRFANVVANLGEGPLTVRLAHAEGAAALAGRGSFVQHVHRDDGTFRAVAAGLAEFHPIHAHYHNGAAIEYRLHAWSEETGRGPEVAASRKTGICFGDVGIAEAGFPGIRDRGYPFEGCLGPRDEGWTMGISPGWFDLYPADLSEQYVDLGDLGDGTYELVSAVNREGGLLESDLTNNEGSAVLRIEGDEVYVREAAGAWRLAGE